MVPKSLQALGKGAAIISGEFSTVNIAASAPVAAFRSVVDEKQEKFALPCGVCNGKGFYFYICKLCQGNGTIKWSPLYDHIHVNPSVCPTCEGNRVQCCLNCLGKGYS